MIINNVTRLLDQKKIRYERLQLPGNKISAVDVAEFAGVEPGLIYKSIVLTQKDKGKPILAVVPGNTKVDLKKVAAVLGIKKIQTTTHDEAERLTGLQTGGISPLALFNKGFVILVDESINTKPAIFVSGGQRDLNIKLAPDDLLNLLNARVCDISKA